MRKTMFVGVLMTAVLFGCNKNKKPVKNDGVDQVPPPAAGAAPGGGGPTVIPGGGIGVVVNPNQALGGGGGGGAVSAVRKAATRVRDGLNEMNTLGEVISLLLNDLGRMPTKEQIVAELKQYPKLLAAVNDGAFILTGTTEAGGLWAYEADADKTPGIALIGGRAARSTPEELRPYFAKPPMSGGATGKLVPQQSAPAAAGKQAAAAVGKQDMEDIRIYIDNASGASGVMPSPQQVYEALVAANSPAAALVRSKAIILTGARTREEIWALDAAALQNGGLICGPNGVESVAAAGLKQRLGLK
jgi:hypothetical protein